MSFLFANGQSSPPNKRLGLFDTQTSTNEQAQPLAYLAGKRRFAGTFITDAFDQHTSSQSGGGKDSGKGGGGSGTNYYAGFAVAFCLGPVDSFSNLLLNGDEVFTSNTYLTPSPSNQGLTQINNVATFHCANPHGLTTGQQMLIVGADQPEFNGEFEITVTDAYDFTYVIPGSSILAEIASGQIQAWTVLDTIYRGTEDSITMTIPKYGTMTLHWGTQTDVSDPYLQVSGTNHPPYHGVCYAVFQKFFLGLNQTNIQNVEIVLSRCPSAPWQNLPTDNNINDEANAVVVFYDLLTNPRCGLGLTAADFNTPALAAVASRLVAEGIGISPIITTDDVALSLLQRVCESIDAVPLLDPNGLISLVLIRPAANYGALPTIGDPQLADIPKIKAADWSNVFTETRIVFPNADAAWNSDFVEWKDFSSIITSQKTAQPQALQRDYITNRTTASALVQAAGLIGAAPPLTGTIQILFTVTNWLALAPGNLFHLEYTLRPAMTGYYRVTKRTWQDSSKPVFEVEFGADRSYLNMNL